ncbi:MAG: adenylate kinase [Candidatus Omnitrophica bacterium]|nr:adenylate kinase [Candidatus Omnitrophota bacterium]
MTVTKQLNMILLGAPGAGKGTQAEILVKNYGLLHISTGNMLREAVKEGSPIGKQLSEFMSKGALVPDEIVTKVVIDRMAKPDAQKGVILDGYPRTKVQAKSLDESLNASKKNLQAVLYLKVSEAVVIERLCGRRGCKDCGKIFHVKNMPPKKEGICDVCGGALFQREDDKPETIKTRLKVYEESTKDLIEYYKAKGLLREMDAGSDPDALFKEINVLFQKEGLL